MILNRYEYEKISNDKLPVLWQSQEALEELEDFLQQNWEQRAVFYDDDDIHSKQQFLQFLGRGVVKTKNYIGTISFNGDQLNIFPRIFLDEEDADKKYDELSQKHLIDNLLRWVEYCNKFSYPFINISAEIEDTDNLKELLIVLYLHLVKNAIDRGLYYQYVEETTDCTYIKGKFNVKDYITNKVPDGQLDKFECTYSSFEFDNKVNRIIKCTCKFLLSISENENSQKLIRNILTRFNDVSDTRCIPSDCDGIMLSKMHRNYDVILSMSKMFLLNKISNYTLDNTNSFCFLFPTELLFEGFIGGFIKEVITNDGGKVYLQKSDMSLIDDIYYGDKSLGAAFNMRHDILVEQNSKVFILDTKYKLISRFADSDEDELKANIKNEIKQQDIYQVSEYAHKRGISDVYLLYPLYKLEDDEPIFPYGINKSDYENIRVHFIRLPFVFNENETEIKERLVSIIKNILYEDDEFIRLGTAVEIQ